MGMLAVGLLFKVGAVPFQAWTPDVYQGAPTAVTAFMAACTKVAAFGALLRLFYVAFGADRWSWQPMMWVVAILTMLVGAIVACAQTDVKRMLAYSSIAHTGFLLTGMLGVRAATELGDNEITSLQAVLFYLATYGPSTIGAFAIVTLVRDAGGEATSFEKWTGLGSPRPARGGRLRLLPAVDGRHPADRRLHGQVGGVHGRAGRRRLAGGARRHPVEHHLGVLLRPADAPDVLPRRDAGGEGDGRFRQRDAARRGSGDRDPDRLATVTKPSVLTTGVIAVSAALTLCWASCRGRCSTCWQMPDNSSGDG